MKSVTFSCTKRLSEEELLQPFPVSWVNKLVLPTYVSTVTYCMYISLLYHPTLLSHPYTTNHCLFDHSASISLPTSNSATAKDVNVHNEAPSEQTQTPTVCTMATGMLHWSSLQGLQKNHVG